MCLFCFGHPAAPHWVVIVGSMKNVSSRAGKKCKCGVTILIHLFTQSPVLFQVFTLYCPYLTFQLLCTKECTYTSRVITLLVSTHDLTSGVIPRLFLPLLSEEGHAEELQHLLKRQLQ